MAIPTVLLSLRTVLYSIHIAVTRVLEGDGAIWKMDGEFISKGISILCCFDVPFPKGKRRGVYARKP
jgi:hypothetical protein